MIDVLRRFNNMRRLLLAMAILALASSVAFAGPNAGVVLMVHGNQDATILTEGDVCGTVALPAACEDLIPSAVPDNDSGEEWFLVLVVSPPENTPNFNTAVFGLGDWDTGAIGYIDAFGSCVAGALDAPYNPDTWPSPNNGTAVSWSPECLYGYMEPIYFFGVYVYGTGTIPLAGHPTQAAVVVDCTANPAEDPFEGFGIMGIGGGAGDNPPCPGGTQPDPWACCFGTTCVMLTQDECTAQGGDSWWDGIDCEPENDPCYEEPPTPTRDTTWGTIKSIYR